MGESYKFGYWGKTSEEVLHSQFPLHRCCRDGDLEALSTLLQRNCHSIHVEDSFYGWTPAHWAAYFGKLGCLRKLLSGHVNGHVATTRFKQTPAHVAAYGGHPSLLQWLLQAGAHLEDKDYLGETPLHKAARTGSMECLSLLVAHGADLSVLNNNQHTANQLAKACGYYECARYLDTVLEQRTQQPLMSSVYNDDGMDCETACVKSQNGVSGGDGDILLLDGVGRNHVPVAGKKRPREDVTDETTKRLRTSDMTWSYIGVSAQNVDVPHTMGTFTCAQSPALGQFAVLPYLGTGIEYTPLGAVASNVFCRDELGPSVIGYSVEVSPAENGVVGHQAHQRTEDVLFAIGACMSPSASILSVPTHAMHSNQHGRQNTTPRPCVFAV